MKMDVMGGTRGTYGTQERCIQDFGGEILWKEIKWKPKHRWEDNIKMDIQEWGWGSRNDLIWLRIGTSGGWL